MRLSDCDTISKLRKELDGLLRDLKLSQTDQMATQVSIYIRGNGVVNTNLYSEVGAAIRALAVANLQSRIERIRQDIIDLGVNPDE